MAPQHSPGQITCLPCFQVQSTLHKAGNYMERCNGKLDVNIGIKDHDMLARKVCFLSCLESKDCKDSLAYNNIEISSLNPLLVRCTNGGGSSRYILIEREDIRDRADRSDREWVDLLVTLGVVRLDVSEFRRIFESIVVPVQVAHPPRQVSMIDFRLT